MRIRILWKLWYIFSWHHIHLAWPLLLFGHVFSCFLFIFFIDTGIRANPVLDHPLCKKDPCGVSADGSTGLDRVNLDHEFEIRLPFDVSEGRIPVQKCEHLASNCWVGRDELNWKCFENWDMDCEGFAKWVSTTGCCKGGAIQHPDST